MLPRELREKIVTPKSDPLAKMRKDGGGSTGNTVRGKESGGAMAAARRKSARDT